MSKRGRKFRQAFKLGGFKPPKSKRPSVRLKLNPHAITVQDTIDLDRESIRLDEEDATSLFMQLSMKVESAQMNYEKGIRQWVFRLHYEGATYAFEADTQLSALQRAKAALSL